MLLLNYVPGKKKSTAQLIRINKTLVNREITEVFETHPGDSKRRGTQIAWLRLSQGMSVLLTPFCGPSVRGETRVELNQKQAIVTSLCGSCKPF